MVKYFGKNTKGRDFVVGDIHGCFAKLQYELTLLNFDPEKDRLFSVGDLVDRGADSHLFEEWLEKPWFHAVRGNHEQMLIDAVRDTSEDGRVAVHHYLNGGEWMYGLPDVQRQCYAILCEELPIAIEVETDAGLVGIVHAECPLQDWNLFKALFETNEHYFSQVAMWARMKISTPDSSDVVGLHKMYVGHTVVDEPVRLGNVRYIDTGACFGQRPLTIVQIN